MLKMRTEIQLKSSNQILKQPGLGCYQLSKLVTVQEDDVSPK